MGATEFAAIGHGSNAAQAYADARQAAVAEYGHDAYSGTIAAKRGWVEFTLPDGMTARQYRDALRDGDDEAAEVYDDKWGPCVAVKVADNRWVFMGWASE